MQRALNIPADGRRDDEELLLMVFEQSQDTVTIKGDV